MESDLIKKNLPNKQILSDEVFKILSPVVKSIVKKYPKACVSIIAKKTSYEPQGLNLMFIIDDLNNVVMDSHITTFKSDFLKEVYNKDIGAQVETALASRFWTKFQLNNQDVINIVRYSLSLHDIGFFRPLQELLVTGKRRPSSESVKVYYVKALKSLKTSDDKIKKAIVDLYWAVTDTAHAAVMMTGTIPPSPAGLSKLIKEELVNRNHLHKRCGEIYDEIYSVGKRIMHKEVFSITGKDFDKYLSDTEFFMRECNNFVRNYMHKENTKSTILSKKKK